MQGHLDHATLDPQRFCEKRCGSLRINRQGRFSYGVHQRQRHFFRRLECVLLDPRSYPTTIRAQRALFEPVDVSPTLQAIQEAVERRTHPFGKGYTEIRGVSSRAELALVCAQHYNRVQLKMNAIAVELKEFRCSGVLAELLPTERSLLELEERIQALEKDPDLIALQDADALMLRAIAAAKMLLRQWREARADEEQACEHLVHKELQRLVKQCIGDGGFYTPQSNLPNATAYARAFVAMYQDQEEYLTFPPFQQGCGDLLKELAGLTSKLPAVYPTDALEIIEQFCVRVCSLASPVDQ